MINKKKNYKYKSILIIGVGKWGKTLTKFFLQNDWNVMYATRDGKPNTEFELFFSSKKLSHFNISKAFQFDLISICVKPADIFLVWKKYKYLSFKFLIEKPGSNELSELKQIFNEANEILFLEFSIDSIFFLIIFSRTFSGILNSFQTFDNFI